MGRVGDCGSGMGGGMDGRTGTPLNPNPILSLLKLHGAADPNSPTEQEGIIQGKETNVPLPKEDLLFIQVQCWIQHPEEFLHQL